MKQKNIVTTIIFIIIFLIILFLLIGKFGVIEVKMPTGYVDIFDINLVFNCNCNCLGDESNCACSSECGCKSLTLGVSDVWQDDESNTNELEVYDKDVKYEKGTTLNIFSHKSYHIVDDIIAPESQNSYQFIVRNNNKFPIIYELKFNEINEFNINMKYRLKLNGKYVLGDDKTWLTARRIVAK